MKEEITRINRLVAEGKLSPEDAADLIEAIATRVNATPPPPPEPPPAAKSKDPIKGVFDFLDRLASDGKESVDWNEVGRQAKESARRGVEVLRQGIDDVAKGKVNLDWMTTSERKEVEFEIPELAGKILRVENPSGSVKIIGGSEVASVEATAHFRGTSLEDAKAKAAVFTLSADISDHVVLVKHPEIPGIMLDLVIRVPVQTPVELKLEAGDAQVNDTMSSLRLISRSGNVVLSGLDGPIEVTSDSGSVEIGNSRTPSLTLEHKSGNVHLRHVDGNVNARTASGDLALYQCTGKVISLESVSGDVDVQTTGIIDGTLNIRTVSGDARIGGSGLFNARIALSTLRGTVRSSIELSEQASTAQRVTGRLGEGLGLIDVSAVTGDITFSPETI